MSRKFLLSAVATFACLWAASGHADVITINNSTQVQAYRGSSPTNFFGSSSWGFNVGGENGYDTTGVVINRQNSSIDFQFQTAFDGLDARYARDGVIVSYADIFINPVFSTAPPASYQYAIALGDQSRNGGLTAGFYQVSSDKTSEQIWHNRSSFIYGGRYAPDNQHSEAQYSPTVLTGGTLLSDWTVSSNYSGGILDVSLSTTDAASFAALFDNFDLFWGTADCSNAPLFAAVDAAPVPEPPAAAVLASGLLAFAFLRRQRRRARL